MSFEKIIGGTEEQKNTVERDVSKASSRSLEETYEGDIVQLSPEEKSSIIRSVNYIDAFAKQYDSKKSISADRIAVLRPGSLDHWGGGVHDTYNNSIAVERMPSLLLFEHVVTHELFHRAGFHSIQIDSSGEDAPYRNGVTMRSRDGGKDYFGIAEEALAATWSENYFQTVLSKDPRFESDLNETAYIKNWMTSHIKGMEVPEGKITKSLDVINSILILPSPAAICEVLKNSNESDDYKFGFVRGYFEDEFKNGCIFSERNEEKDTFNFALESLITQDESGTLTYDLLLDHFMESHFTGNYLPLARLIDGTFEAGRFRKLAEELEVVR